MTPSEARAVAEAVDQQLAAFRATLRADIERDLRTELRTTILAELRAELASSTKSTGGSAALWGQVKALQEMLSDLVRQQGGIAAQVAEVAQATTTALSQRGGGIPQAAQLAMARAVEDWVRSSVGPLFQRIGELEGGAVKYVGVFSPGRKYAKGSLCTDHGALWHANADTTARPGELGSGWTLTHKSAR